MAVTEAFTISNIDESEIGYIHVDRTYKYGGLMILDDRAFPDTAGIKGCTYFDDFDNIICEWCKNVGIDNQTIKLKVNWDVCKDINSSIIDDKKDIIFNIDIKDGKIARAYCDKIKFNNEFMMDTVIDDYSVGMFGMIFNYYTKIITKDINDYKNENTYIIWGLCYE